MRHTELSIADEDSRRRCCGSRSFDVWLLMSVDLLCLGLHILIPVDVSLKVKGDSTAQQRHHGTEAILCYYATALLTNIVRRPPVQSLLASSSRDDHQSVMAYAHKPGRISRVRRHVSVAKVGPALAPLAA